MPGRRAEQQVRRPRRVPDAGRRRPATGLSQRLQPPAETEPGRGPDGVPRRLAAARWRHLGRPRGVGMAEAGGEFKPAARATPAPRPRAGREQPRSARQASSIRISERHAGKLLGPFEAHTGDGRPLLIPGQRPQALLAAMPAGRRRPRSELASLLWGRRDDQRARHSLSQVLTRLRKLVDASAKPCHDEGMPRRVA